jgi:hypothetical protein
MNGPPARARREGRVDGGLDPGEPAVRDAQVTGLDRVVTRPHETHVLDEQVQRRARRPV